MGEGSFIVTIRKRAIIEFPLIVLFILGGIFLMSWLFSFCIDPCLLCSLIPIKIYPNADLQKKQILKENKAKSGIYR